MNFLVFFPQINGSASAVLMVMSRAASAFPRVAPIPAPAIPTRCAVATTQSASTSTEEQALFFISLSGCSGSSSSTVGLRSAVDEEKSVRFSRSRKSTGMAPAPGGVKRRCLGACITTEDPCNELNVFGLAKIV